MCILSQKIRDIAERTNIPRVQGSTSVQSAMKIMDMYKIDIVAVLCEHSFIGVFSTGDFTRNVIRQNLQPEDTTLYEVIRPNPPTVSSDISIKETYEAMIAYQWEYMPVLDRDNLCGIVCLHDLSFDIMKSYDEARAENEIIMNYINGGESYAMADYENKAGNKAK